MLSWSQLGLCTQHKCYKESAASLNICVTIKEMSMGGGGDKEKTFSALFVERKLNCEEALHHEL